MTLKLLLAGKEKSDFQSIKYAFENEDVDIIVATSIGLALYLARKNRPNLIISQQELLDTDALNFFHELKNEQELADIPFVLLVAAEYKVITNKAIEEFAENIIYSNDVNYLPLDIKTDLSISARVRNKILAFIPN